MADVKADAKKEFLGQPIWIWGVAAAVAVAAAIYLYRRNAQNQAAAAAGQTAPGTSPATGVYALNGWVQDQQSSPTPTTTTTPGNCPPGMRPDSSGKCVCGPGFYWNTRTGKCTKLRQKVVIGRGDGPV